MNAGEALILFNLVENFGSGCSRKLSAFFGAPEAAVGKPAEALVAAGLSPETAAKIAALRRHDLDAELLRAEKNNVRIVTLADDAYPESLRHIFSPPPVLYMKGGFSPDDLLAVAMVGSRHASLYGLSTAKAFAAALAEQGFTVVSGMARGIDTQAHTGALERGGRTIAVLGSGFNRIYPPENKKLAEAIERSGCAVSEFPMDAGPLKQHFPRRNRIISGLSLGVLVVEAGRNSGALITADFALEQGREVFAVPGPLDSRSAFGSNDLIKEGAKLVSCVEDIIDEFPFPVNPAAWRKPAPLGGSCPGKSLESGEEELLYAIISGEGVSLDELAQRSGIGICKLSSLLLKMQLSKLIRRMPGNRFSRN
jgi:DNA processing protein